MQTVQASLLPFHLHRKTLQVPEGLTIKEMVDAVFPHQIKGVDIVVNIGDHVIPRSNWSRIRPKSTSVVGLNAIPAGGRGGGKKNPLSSLLSIALVVAAPYITSVIAPTLASGMVGVVGPYTAGQYAIASGIARIGISMVGFLATSMLSSTPKQRPRAQASPQEPSSQFIEGANNKIDRYGPVPVNLGTNRMFPPQAALPYTETVANKQYARQIFTYGFGKVRISERRLGETLISEYEGVEMNDRLSADLDEGVELYTNDVYQDGYSVVVSNAIGYVTRTTQPDTDEVDVDITFRNGLTVYNDSAQRGSKTVEFDIQFAPTGTTNWSAGNSNVLIATQDVTVPQPSLRERGDSTYKSNGILVLNLYTGVVRATTVDNIPQDSIRIASFRTEGVTQAGANVYDLVDERSSYIPTNILNSTDFSFTYGGTGLTITIAAGTLTAKTWKVTDATAQALRVVKNLRFPTTGQYDVRIKRITVDSVDDRTRDEATLTAIRSIKHSSPIFQPDISGTALRILATDQLNGSVSSFNCIVSTLMKDYDSDAEQWVDDAVTSNPASIYRYVLQTPAFVKRLDDSQIDLEKLQEWHIFCQDNNLTYNEVVDGQTSIDDLLNDIAAAGMATVHKISGVYSVLIDNERPIIKGMVTPRNSWGYSGSITYPDLPHGLRVQFRNKAAGYKRDERIVYADGYDSSNATLFERLQFDSCTDAELAWFYGRRYIATATLQPESHTFNMDFENLTFNRGDKIIFVNDVILVGVGSARIRELIYDDPDTPTEVIGFIIDDVVNIPTADQFGVRIRHSDASGFIYYGLNTVIGETNEFTFTTPVAYASRPPIGSLCAFTEFGEELELIITEIRMNKDHSAAITAINYAPERFNSTSGIIPPFDSKITLPADFYQPQPPIIDGDIISDETVMIRNSDGSYTTRMLISLRNLNESTVKPIVSYRPVGATQWSRPELLSIDPELLIITGLEDGSAYDIRISYQRVTGLQLTSLPLLLSGVVYQGASAAPANVSNFRVSSTDSIGLFEWDNNADIDLSHYVMRFNSVTSGATWETAQVVADNISTNRVILPIQIGTYLIKAVDILGSESSAATTIISLDGGAFNNAVELLDQQPLWAGTKDNVQVIDGELYLIDQTLVGYYYFDPEPLDLTEIYECTLSSSLTANGVFYNRVRGWSSVRAETSVRSSESVIIRDVASIRSMFSTRGIDAGDWSITLQMRISDDNITWSAWQTFTVGKQIFRYIEFRLMIQSFDPNINVRVAIAEVTVDMPDRYETGEDQTCPPSGLIVTYTAPFKNNPSVNITLQDGAVDDRLEYVYKTSAGFHVKVYNATSAAYVTRSLDYNSAGYGRVIS